MKRILLLLPYLGIIALGTYTYYQIQDIKLKEQEFVEYTELPQGNTVNAIAIELPDTLSFAGEPVPMSSSMNDW